MRVLDCPSVDDIVTTLEACRSRIEARLAMLVGADGLVIDEARAGGAEPGSAGELDLPLVAAEATDLWAVAARLHAAGIGTTPPNELTLGDANDRVVLRRLGGGAFAMLVGVSIDRSDDARAALVEAVPRLEEALA